MNNSDEISIYEAVMNARGYLLARERQISEDVTIALAFRPAIDAICQAESDWTGKPCRASANQAATILEQRAAWIADPECLDSLGHLRGVSTLCETEAALDLQTAIDRKPDGFADAEKMLARIMRESFKRPT